MNIEAESTLQRGLGWGTLLDLLDKNKGMKRMGHVVSKYQMGHSYLVKRFYDS